MKPFRTSLVVVLLLAPLFAFAQYADRLSPDLLGMPGLLSVEEPKFPPVLRPTGINDGYATVAFTVGPDGRIDDAVILEASKAAFGEAVLEMLPGWVLTPESPQSIPRAIPRREVIQFEFKRSGVVTTVSHMDAGKSAFATHTVSEKQIRTLQWEHLATTPERLATARPTVPNVVAARLAGTRVQVNFVIDQHGRVRVPIVIGSAEPQVTMAILSAVRQWRFSPSSVRDEPVLVEVTRSFVLEPSQRVGEGRDYTSE